MAEKKERIKWIDMAKGYGIILVLIGHCDMPYLTDYIYAFHIPLFFFLSGYVFTTKCDFPAYFLNKLRRMVIPYFCLSIPMIFFELFFENNGVINIDGIQSEIYKFFLQERHTTMWYLSSLILLVFIMYPLTKLKSCYLVVIIIISSLCGLLLWRNDIWALPWNFDAALVVLPFFSAGYFVRKRYESSLSIMQSNKRTAFAVLLVFTLLTIFTADYNLKLSGNKIDIFCSNFRIEWLSYIAAFAGIISCFLLSMIYSNNIIRYIGQNSLIFFAWHQSIIMPSLSYLYWKTGISEWEVYQGSTVFKWTTIVLTLFILSLVNELIIHSKIKFILGK